jgi:tRNA threonylcarbamoyl adenosine modification protein YeaZ
MRLLAIDTTGESCSVGVDAGDGRLVLRSERLGRGHAERLFPMIAEAMAESGVAFDSLDRIVVTEGPGSFTGVRVGIAAARGLALVAGCPVIGVGALDVIAAAALPMAGGRAVVAVIDARRGEVYAQAFAADGAAFGEAVAAAPADVAATFPEDAVLAGSGAELVAAAFPAGPAVPAIVSRDGAPDIATLCRLGAAASIPGEPPRPLYLRPPDAKPQAHAQVARR